MNLNQIETQQFILALFKRSDGVRFLLGSGAYEFKEDQLHFAANVMENDVVSVQGNDGYILAGQVRRPATQSFDGYIGTAGTIKSEIENYRREFFSYFRQGYFYTVVYIMADGTAIQRRRGYIVDAPEVRELYQVFPEYHVALNFEDVNYYKYAENADGDEIYSNLANLTSKITATGGLIWDSLGSATTTAEGTNFTIFGTTAEDNLESVQIKGQTTQQTYTGKNLYINSQDFSGTWNNANGWTTSAETYNGLVVKERADSWNGISQTLNVESGKTYTFSLYVKADSERQCTLYFLGGTATASMSPAYFTFTPTSEWQRYFITATCTASGTVQPRLENRTTNSTPTSICGYQLEEGATMTSYEPYVGGIASPNPDYPQTVQTVTGTQTITISDGDSQSQTLSVRLGSVELCKIGTYQDYIYKNNGNWYVHKEVGKTATLNGTENWRESGTTSNNVYQVALSGFNDAEPNIAGYANELSMITSTEWYANRLPNTGLFTSNNLYVRISADNASTLAGFKTYLSTHNLVVYYALATATDTQITDADLISDLNGLLGADTYDGSTSFESSATGNLPAWLVVEAKTGSGGVIWDNIGATWEEGGEAGDTFITVDSITNVFPTITIVGPASNPQISNITTGQILNYTGNITSSQKLVIDIQQKTAKLNGTSVISNVSGDWLYLRPGNNRMVYTIDNAEPNTATVEWQEITG